MTEIQNLEDFVGVLVIWKFGFWICFGLILLDASPDIRVSNFRDI